ncbi:amidohydrolase family protein [Mycobacterium sp. NPDC003449]
MTRRYDVTDAQVHIWADDRPDRLWPPQGRARAHRFPAFGVADLLREMDGAGVARAVLVPPSFEGDRNDVVLDAAGRYPDRFAVMARLDLAAPGAEPRLDELAGTPGVRGLRMTFHRPEMRAGLADPANDWLWSALAERSLPVMVYAPGQHEAIGAVGARHPGLRLVVDTLGLPLGIRDAEIDLPIREILRLADNPNIAVKATALPAYVTDPFPFRSLADRIRLVLNVFGRERVFWASDLTRVAHPYRHIVDFVPALDVASPDELDWLMGRGICTWLGWDVTLAHIEENTDAR